MNANSSDDVRTTFGQRVRTLRKRAGLSQEQLAFKCGLDRTYIGGVERGERNISVVNIEKIARAIDLSPKDLFEDETGA